MISSEKLKRKAEIDQVSLALVFKESVHVVVLEYLFQKGLFSDLVFQGGTALRLAYQGVRYSEDLDFVLRKKDASRFDRLAIELQSLPTHIKRSMPFVMKAQLKTQKTSSSFRRYALMLTADLLPAKDKTNIEIANVPSHMHQTIILNHPDAAQPPAIVVETPEEIFSDKLVAFQARDYIKGRDLWDIHFLMHTLKVRIDDRIRLMVQKKIFDYQLNEHDFWQSFKEKAVSLKNEGPAFLREEMDRFLPVAYRDSFQARFTEINEDVCRTLETFSAEHK